MTSTSTEPRPAASKADAAGMPPAIRFVLATMVINAMGFGIIVPVVPSLLMELGSVSISGATAIGGWLALTFAVMQFLCSPIVGNLSDRFGRRPVLLASMGGFALDFIVLAIAPTLLWVFLARGLSGLFGASNGPAQSVIADLIPADRRARYYGLIGAAFGVGFVLGPVIGGLLGEWGPRVPFWLAAALTGANFIYGYFVLPETLAPENRRPFVWRRANPVGALLHVRKLPGIAPIATTYLLWQVATLIYPMTWAYFAIGRYGWSHSLVGGSLAMVGLSIALSQTLVLPRMNARFGERQTAMIGIVGGALTMLGYVFADTTLLALLLLPFVSFQSLVHPNLTAMMTRRASASTQGEVQGFASAIMALGSLAAPLVFNPLLAWFTGPKAPFIFHGAAFALAGLLALACLPVLRLVGRSPNAQRA